MLGQSGAALGTLDDYVLALLCVFFQFLLEEGRAAAFALDF